MLHPEQTGAFSFSTDEHHSRPGRFSWTRARQFFADHLSRNSVAASAEVGPQLPAPEGKTWNRVVIVHWRLPFSVGKNAEGKPALLPSTGGLVTALKPLMQAGNFSGKWIGWPGTWEEEGLDEAVRAGAHGYDLSAVRFSQEEYQEYYEEYNVGVLIPLFEGQMEKIDVTNVDATHLATHEKVQKKYAEVVREDLRSGDIVWIHDQNMTGVCKELRSMGVKNPIGYFLHLPFPELEKVRLLPESVREVAKHVVADILAHDVIGFQTAKFQKNFLDAVQEFVPEAVLEKSSGSIMHIRLGERLIRVGAFPISINTEEFAKQAESPDTEERVQELERDLRQDGEVQVIFNSGRLDYIKGFYEELQAFDLLLEKHPEFVGRMVLCQQIVPSRKFSPEHQAYEAKIRELADRINAKHRERLSRSSDQEGAAYEGMPVRQIHAHMDRNMYLAYLRVADIVSTPTLADGMNLTAKEAAIVGRDTMVQVLGEAAGAAEELGEHALTVDPRDIEALADAFYRAYTMQEGERIARKTAMARIVTANDVFKWWEGEQAPMFQEVWDERTAEKP